MPGARAAVLGVLLLAASCASTPRTAQPAGPAPYSPGATNPAVSQATIGTTVCVPGWTASIRPPTSYTTALKRRQMAAMHLSGDAADYEEDHTLPLALGGAPRDERNLRPVPILQARSDDREETRLHAVVCAGRMTLADGQRAILQWKAAHG